MRAIGYLVGLSLSALAVSNAQAQVVTTITPDSGGSFDVGTTVATSGTSHTISGGTLSNTNLLHSFSIFDLANGEIAQWVRGWRRSPWRYL